MNNFPICRFYCQPPHDHCHSFLTHRYWLKANNCVNHQENENSFNAYERPRARACPRSQDPFHLDTEFAKSFLNSKYCITLDNFKSRSWRLCKVSLLLRKASAAEKIWKVTFTLKGDIFHMIQGPDNLSTTSYTSDQCLHIIQYVFAAQ